MKTLIITFITVVLFGCAGSNRIFMQPNQIYIIENDGKPLFSLGPPKDGKWYISSAETMKWGTVNIKGAPDNPYLGYALRFGFITNNAHPKFLSSVIPVLKTGDYEKFLRDSLDFYTPEVLAEQKKSNPGGKVIDIRGIRCKNFWVSEHIGPNINNPRYGGQGISVHSNYIICPLVIDGVINQFNVSIRSSILDKLYLEKEAYDQNKKPDDPEFIIDPEAIMRELGENVVKMFSTLKIYGNISQSYEDVTIKCHPTLGDEC